MALTDKCKYAVGDIVYIRSDLRQTGKYYDENGSHMPITSQMVRDFAGRVCTIREIYVHNHIICYLLEEDNSKKNLGKGWYFVHDMIEGHATHGPEISDDNLMTMLSM